MDLTLELRLHDSLRAVDPAAWDALVGAHWPFLEHAFLYGLETTGCVGPQSGWQPLPLTIYDGDTLVAAAPLFARTDSYGEFIFDWAWADFYHRMGARYYPKLTVAPPFTPATGPRLLVHPAHPDPDKLRLLLADGIQAVGDKVGASGAHVLFCEPDESALLAEHGWIRRQTLQTGWHNPGHATFDVWLETLRAPARKHIRKERREVAAYGLTIQSRRGTDLPDAGWDALWQFYQINVERHGSEAYLNEAFFHHLRTHLGDRVWAVTAQEGDRYIAGTLSLQKGTHLYGRYWGCLEERPFLHFELAFYQLMEDAIRHGWTRFEPGAGGGHKLKRGMLPILVESAHWLAEPKFRHAIAAHVSGERDAMAERAVELLGEATVKRVGETSVTSKERVGED